MKEQLDIVKQEDIYIVFLKHQDRNIVGCRWAYKIKQDATGNIMHHKACLVAQGYSQ